jgi:hypothetical protein
MFLQQRFLVCPPETWPGNNVSWFVHLWETWLGKINGSLFVHVPLANIARKNNVSWFVHATLGKHG